jgi:hypothetical protein
MAIVYHMVLLEEINDPFISRYLDQDSKWSRKGLDHFSLPFLDLVSFPFRFWFSILLSSCEGCPMMSNITKHITQTLGTSVGGSPCGG